MSASFFKGLAVGVTFCLATGVAASAYAGTGVGALFNLGKPNSVNKTTSLSGSTAGAQLKVSNTSTSSAATGLTISVKSGHAPLTVSSSSVVKHLNANYLQGKSAASFLPVTGTAADSTKLGGVAASSYLRNCGPTAAGVVPGAVMGRAVITGSSASSSLSTTGVTGGFVCSGQSVQVRRDGTGLYRVVFGDTASNNTIGLPQYASGEVALVTPQSGGVTATAYGPNQCASSPPPYITCFTVSTTNLTGTAIDATFSIVVL